MAKFTSQVNVGENLYRTYKMDAATVTDADVGKPVKLHDSDEVELCADGDQIYGFIAAVDGGGTADGKTVVSVLVDGRIWVELDGNSAVGTLVEAAANEAAGTANAGGYGLVSTHAAVDDTNGTTILATIPKKCWMVVSGTGLDEAIVLIEKL
jgi:hypothetical protein